jgi:hypothetical protein
MRGVATAAHSSSQRGFFGAPSMSVIAARLNLTKYWPIPIFWTVPSPGSPKSPPAAVTRSRRVGCCSSVLAMLCDLTWPPSITSGATATNANSQTPPTANAVTAANSAFSGFHDGDVAMPDNLGALPIAALFIPASGNYVINAKLDAHNVTIASDNPLSECRLRAGGDVDTLDFDVVGAGEDDHEAVALQVVHTFTSPGTVTLSCTDNGNGDVVAEFTKITAVPVAQLSNVEI